MKSHDVILYPLMTERAVNMIENENKLVFVVDRRAVKDDVAKAVSELYEVEAEAIRTIIDHNGVKKAFVKLKKEHNATDVAIKLGIL